MDTLLFCDMVIKIFKAQATFSAIGYHMRKMMTGKAELMKVSGFGALKHLGELRAEDYLNYLQAQSALNKNVRLPQFHAMISAPDLRVDKKELTKLAGNWMKAMGYGKQPYLLVFHKDTDQAHVHLVSTRVARNGKKIDSAFEHRRAIAELNKLLKLNEGHQAMLDAGKALSYACSTRAQVMLLLEGMGYLLREKDSDLVLYKYGQPQFVIRSERLDQTLARFQPDEQRKYQLRAIFRKYQPELDCTLKPVMQTLPGGREAEKAGFHSEFADFLKAKFGLELLFHASGDKPPYGYTVIDHAQQRVFKGSELMKLGEMLGTGTVSVQRVAESGDGAERPKKKLNLNLRLQFSTEVDDQQIHGPRRRRQKKARTNTR